MERVERERIRSVVADKMAQESDPTITLYCKRIESLLADSERCERLEGWRRKMEESKPMTTGTFVPEDPCPRCGHSAKDGPVLKMIGDLCARATADEAARAEKEPLAERTQGVDVEKLRTDLALYHGLGEQNITALLDELEEAREQIAVFLPTVKVAQRRQDAAEARVAELEQRLRVVADPDGEEREALRARVKELERILSAERAEYDWAVKGAKELGAQVAEVRDVANANEVVGPGGFTAGQKYVQGRLLTILNGGTDGTA